MPAIELGERRILVRGRVCPLLSQNLRVAGLTMQGWRRGSGHAAIEIEADGFEERAPADGAAALFSGGVDAACLLADNAERFGEASPHRVRHAILVDGFDIGGFHADPDGSMMARSAETCRAMLAPRGVRLWVVRTNLIELLRDNGFWERAHHGAGCAAAAHVLKDRFGRASIGSTFRADRIEPWGSHAVMDHWFSSADLSVLHHGADLTRFEKTRVVSRHPELLARLQVCFVPEKARPAGYLNCGRCGKCVRTKIALELLGAGQPEGLFQTRELEGRHIERLPLNEYGAAAYREMIAAADESVAEHRRLAEAMRGALRRYARSQRVRRVDRALSGGRAVPLAVRAGRRAGREVRKLRGVG